MASPGPPVRVPARAGTLTRSAPWLICALGISPSGPFHPSLTLEAPARPGLFFERDLLDWASHFSEPEIDHFVMARRIASGSLMGAECDLPACDPAPSKWSECDLLGIVACANLPSPPAKLVP